jgi:hypothetical protein
MVTQTNATNAAARSGIWLNLWGAAIISWDFSEPRKIPRTPYLSLK